MNLKNFENQISPVIFERGENYYLDNAVTDLQDMENGQWFAIVEGSEEYEVEIRLDDKGEINNFDCNCPYDGPVCKHVVAVLLMIRYEKPDHPTEEKKDKKHKEKDEWKALVSTVPEDELRDFIMEYAAKNKEFRNSFKTGFLYYTDNDSCDKYSSIIKDAFSMAGGRRGFIDYYHTGIAMRQVNELLVKADKHIETGNLKEAFYIVSAIAPECINAIQEMDDSDGECGGAVIESFETILKIYVLCKDDKLKCEVFDWVLQQANNPDYEDYGCGDNLTPLLIDIADTPENICRVREFLNKQLENTTKLEGWSKENNNDKYLKFKVDLYRKSGDDEEAERIILDNMEITDFREHIVNNFIAEGKEDQAIQLIKEGIELARKKNHPGVESKWEEKLLEINLKRNDIKEIRKYASGLFFRYRYEMKFYRILKSTYSPDEWPDIQEEIITGILNKHHGNPFVHMYFSSHAAGIFIEEKQWERLFGLVKQHPEINNLLEYTEYLSKDYSVELICLYRKAILDYAEKYTGRKYYVQIRAFILKMAGLIDGNKPARQLVTDLLAMYGNRPAMTEELKKIIDKL